MSKKTPVKKDNTTRNITIAMIIFVLVSGVGFKLYADAQKKKVPLPALAKVAAESDKAMVLNSEVKNVPVVDIWEDFQCPVCKKFEESTGATLAKLIDEKKVVARYHIVSFIGPESVQLANASACAADQGKFREIHDFFYKNQPEGENTGFWNLQTINLAGKAVGLTNKQFTDCVKKGDYANYVAYIYNDMIKAKVNSTPTIFVDGKELDRATQYYDPVAFEKAVTESK